MFDVALVEREMKPNRQEKMNRIYSVSHALKYIPYWRILVGVAMQCN